MASGNKVPFKLHMGASIIGGIIGALNPALFLFNPSYIENIQQRFHVNYTAYASTTLGFFLLLLFIPCTLSTFFVYPWLYRRLAAFTRTGNSPGLGSYAKLGTIFGCMATCATAFFFMMEAILFNVAHGQATGIGSSLMALIGGTLLLSILGLFLLPVIVITGSLFAWGNYRLIRKSAA